MTDPTGLQKLVAGFLVEAQEIVDAVARDTLILERARSDDEVNTRAGLYDRVARGLHTLKGTSATLELEEPASIAHDLETLIAPHARATAPLPTNVVGELLGGLDRLMNVLRAAIPADANPAGHGLAVEAARDVDADGSWRVQGRQLLAVMRDIERLRELHLRLTERRREIASAIDAIERAGRAARVAHAGGGAGDGRIDTTETRQLLAALAVALRADSEDSGQIVDSLEDGVKAICTAPVRSIVQPLRRAVRDLCLAQGKEAQLATVGDDVSVDRRVLESLRGPLIHMVRNAVDHGVELPGEREAAGKHREAQLVIRVEQQGNLVFLEVSDDGRGIDHDSVRAAAARAGVPKTELDALGDDEVLKLIFRAGLSTRARVDETSGRGVGLDVVRSQIAALNGSIEVTSKRGQGTRFMMTIPAELGSSPVLVMKVGEHELGLPMLAVERVVPARPDDVQVRRMHMKSQMTWRHGDVFLPLINLGALLGVRQPELPSAGQPILLVHAQNGSLGLLVDEVIGDCETVIRPLPTELSDARAYQGAAAMARGDLILVLRPDWLAEASAAPEQTAAGGTPVRRALVVDDSLTARALHRSMLEAGGFAVHAVASARQALSQLQKAVYDVIVADIQMPEMDGLAFTRAVRAQPSLHAVPIVVVTSHDGGGQRDQARSDGADAFLTKLECASGGLLAGVNAAMLARGGAS